MYSYKQRPKTAFSQEAEELIPNFQQEEYVVFVGKNNCGKSFLLKTLKQRFGVGSFYLGPARYQNFNLLTFYLPGQTTKENKHREFMNQFNQDQQNIDNSPVNLQQSISELSDAQRDFFAEIMKNLLDVDIGIESTDPLNTMSQKYISCSGHNLSFTSSGLRLVATLVTSLLDPNYDTFLIDEPELGISPEAQGRLLIFFLIANEERNIFHTSKH